MKLPQTRLTRHCRTFQLAVLWYAALVIGLPPVHAAAESASEYAVKAAIIFKIAKFVSWPESAFSNLSEPLSICVQKDDPIADAMSALSGKSIQGRVFSVRYFDKSPVISDGCQILFLSTLQEAMQPDLLEAITNQPILTIGDNDQFTALGGIIGLEINSDRVQFTINIVASESAGLDISSQLLQLAKIADNDQGT
ncbi:MAG: hypothetical protein CL797_10160 [Chromatiales bacterium]|jgi:hypothetical protein|nr:hypothetical protein [Chromatiales bacterium]